MTGTPPMTFPEDHAPNRRPGPRCVHAVGQAGGEKIVSNRIDG